MSDDFVKVGNSTMSPRPTKEELTFPEDESKLGLYWFHMYWNKYHDCVELEARVMDAEDALYEIVQVERRDHAQAFSGLMKAIEKGWIYHNKYNGGKHDDPI
jgi:hypothetical protein